MKAYLLHPDRDVDLEQELPPHAEALKQDLGLDMLLDVMAADDAYLRERAELTVLNGLDDPDVIRYRQEALADCLQAPDVARELYALTIEALDAKQKARFFWFRDSPSTQLQKALAMLDLLVEVLRKVRSMADRERDTFRSQAFRKLIATLQDELEDEYITTVDRHLHELRFKRGALLSATLGRGNRGSGYVLRKPEEQSFFERITPGGPPHYSFSIPPRDEHGAEALATIRDRGINHAANAVAQAADHVLSFFTMLRAELGFYIACLNLHEQLSEKGEPTSFPSPKPACENILTARGLYDGALTFHLGGRAVGNDLRANGKSLVIVTGANQGGKSTFLRSVGIAQLMMQAGMFVAAEEFTASVAAGIYTHFKREEDASMTQGKLDEELSRMSELVALVEPSSILLCNESFASTNEREGSEIARQLVRALSNLRVRTIYVTHLYDLANGFYEEDRDDMLFLRAERRDDGSRTFRLKEAGPLPTSYGADSFRRIFGRDLTVASSSLARDGRDARAAAT